MSVCSLVPANRWKNIVLLYSKASLMFREGIWLFCRRVATPSARNRSSKKNLPSKNYSIFLKPMVNLPQEYGRPFFVYVHILECFHKTNILKKPPLTPWIEQRQHVAALVNNAIWWVLQIIFKNYDISILLIVFFF